MFTNSIPGNINIHATQKITHLTTIDIGRKVLLLEKKKFFFLIIIYLYYSEITSYVADLALG